MNQLSILLLASVLGFFATPQGGPPAIAFDGVAYQGVPVSVMDEHGLVQPIGERSDLARIVARSGSQGLTLSPDLGSDDETVGTLPLTTGGSGLTMHAEWIGTNGTKWAVDTPALAGESSAKQAARHVNAVNDLQVLTGIVPKVGMLLNFYVMRRDVA